MQGLHHLWGQGRITQAGTPKCQVEIIRLGGHTDEWPPIGTHISCHHNRFPHETSQLWWVCLDHGNYFLEELIEPNENGTTHPALQ